MAINFPDPSASPWYNDPASGGNGVTYVYTSGGYWTAVQVTGSNAIDQTTGDARYVNVSGDNMTGNLTLDTNKITLNTNGSATFKSTVDVTSATYTYIGRRSSDNTATFAATDAGYVNIGPVSGNNSNIILNGTNGTITAAGNIYSQVGNQFAALSYAGITQSKSDGTTAAQILPDGSATFGSGNFDLAEYGALSIKRTDGNNYPLLRWGTDANYTGGGIYPNGAAYFAGNVGIGLTNPGDYHANANSLVSSGGITLANTTMGSIFFADSATGTGEYVGQLNYDHGSDFMQFIVNASERMRIDSNGHLLLGTTTAGFASYGDNFTIADSSHCGMTLRGGTTSDCELFFADGTTGTSRYSGGIRYSHNTDYMMFTVNAAERMRINSSGNVGLGTSAPTSNIHVHTSSSLGNSLRFTNQTTGASSTNGLNFGLDDSENAYIWHWNAQDFYIGTSSTERVRITSAGSLKITANGNVDNIYSGVAATGTNATVFRGSHSASAGTPGTGTDSIYIFANGNIQNTNNSYGQISDIKLKENIVDAPSQWNDFKAVRFRKYNFKAETGHETHTQLGVIAQELELTCPGLVYEIADKDEDGNDLGTTTKAVKSSVLTEKALVALQEAMARIETLETKVAQLEGN